MSVRLFCVFLCAGILHISAFPTPEDTTDYFEIYGTQDPSVVNEDLIEGAESSLDESVIEPESEGNSETETSTDEAAGQESGNAEPELNTNEESSLPNPEPESNTSQESSPSEPEPKTNTNQESSASNPKVSAEDSNKDNPGKSITENEVPNSDASSEGETAVIDSANQEPNGTGIVKTDSDGSKDINNLDGIDFTIVRDTYVYGNLIQVAEGEKDDKKIFCQVLRNLFSGQVLDKACVAIEKPQIVSIGEKLIHGVFGTRGDLYTCQEIVTAAGGTVQELCVTHDAWVYL